MKIFIGADHRGFALISNLKPACRQGRSQISKWGYKIEDLGTDSAESADYPLIAERVTREVVKNPDSLGILICGSGQGMAVASNKIKGSRAGVGINPEATKAGREDDHINILCLSADFVDEKTNLEIIESFLNATPKTDERYLRRLSQITKRENQS